MVKYTCEKCGKEFSQKGYYTKHLNKKKPCVVESKVKDMLDKIDEEKPNKIDLNTIDLQNIDGMKYLESVKDTSIDLILTYPPYIISRENGMNSHYNKVKDNEIKNVETKKS